MTWEPNETDRLLARDPVLWDFVTSMSERSEESDR